ncbi:hypothetical protein GN958_ATG07622 [Phytophthora infestans]|uniref:Uncharacterized protein n=1 Tax=Phytophthora infestans TaxID=4787 RepID=A0A8S9UR54_PHYIN|nr:hypothetical protein GN958_ATG07622 [Phytophthora infestans]
MTNTPTPLRQAISAQDRFTEADAPSMTDDEIPAQFELISSPGGDDQDDDSKRDFVSDPRDSSNSSDTLQDLLNEIDDRGSARKRRGRPKDSKRKKKRIPSREKI